MAKPHKDTPCYYEYTFAFDDGGSITHRITLDKETAISAVPTESPPSDWARLSFHQCDGCQLKDTEYCPIAVRLEAPLKSFNSYISHKRVKVTVTSEERSISKETDLQDGLRSLFGLVMATSGCPSMAPFKPMARFHLPFSSIDETVYRVTSMYLLDKFFRHEEEKMLPFNMEEIFQLYETIQHINMGVMKRLRAVAEKDSTLNAVTVLDTYASLVPMYIENKLYQLKPLFSQ